MRGLQPIVSRSSEINNLRLTSEPDTPLFDALFFQKERRAILIDKMQSSQIEPLPAPFSLSASAVNRLSPNVKTATRRIFILVATHANG